jgi:preprotein translocase subunit SecA
VRADEPAQVVQNVQQTSSDSSTASGFASAAQAAAGAGELTPEAAAAAAAPVATKQAPVVRDEWSKTPRNAPCPCGSGKKFKLCHGATV